MILTSPQSPLLKKIRKAIAHGGLTDDGLAVAEGPKLALEAAESGCRMDRLLVMEGMAAPEVDFIEVTWVAPAAFREIKGTEHSQGVIALVEAPVWTLAQCDTSLVLVLDAIQDPGNAGTMIRAAEAFGVSVVAMRKGCVDPWNPKCLRASAGSLFRLPVVTGFADEGALADLPWYAATGQAGGTLIGEVDWTQPSVLVIGNEGRGVDPALLARCMPVTIPTRQVESLNAAVAASVILYEASRQRG